MDKIKIKPLLFWVLGTLGVGALSGLISMGAMKHYSKIDRPPLSPPSWLFPAVWTVLFLLMGVSAYLVWTKEGAPETRRNRAVLFYCLQLGVNFFWPIIFFNAGAYLVALMWLILLIALVILTVRSFYGVSRPAARLNIPYLAWLAFACYLNAGVWWLNS